MTTTHPRKYSRLEVKKSKQAALLRCKELLEGDALQRFEENVDKSENKLIVEWISNVHGWPCKHMVVVPDFFEQKMTDAKAIYYREDGDNDYTHMMATYPDVKLAVFATAFILIPKQKDRMKFYNEWLGQVTEDVGRKQGCVANGC